MKLICFVLFIWLCLGNSAVAQEKEKIKFSSINQAGFLKGSSDQTYQLQTINGVKYKTWFAGIGVGLEEYYLKTIPVFIDVRKNLFEHKASPFLYADLGISFPSEKEDKGAWQMSVYNKGLYYDVGLGYNIPIKGSLAFNFSAGLSYKQLHEERTYWESFGGNGKEYFEYSFRRVSLKVALQF
ncbi:MAG TPA: hypothetical protein VEV15_13200 [Flavisolibacter sp.]|nr:hypothetical protein [Flavisolibacter sp.]